MPTHPAPVTFAEKLSAATAPDRDRLIDASGPAACSTALGLRGGALANRAGLTPRV